MIPQEPGRAVGVATKMVKSVDKPIKYRFVAQYKETIMPIHIQKMLAVKHNYEKLVIALLLMLGARLITYHFR